MKLNKPDFSSYVVHFTKDGAACNKEVNNDPIFKPFASMKAMQRLFSILEKRQIIATKMPWTNQPAVCFTECTWGSLLFHAKNYSKYGVGFHKDVLFGAGGGPAIYLSPGLMEHQKTYVGTAKYPFQKTLYSFVTPFVPAGASKTYKDKYWKGKKVVDYTHEREWRVPHDFGFAISNVAFVIVNKYEDIAKAPTPLKDDIGRDKWLLIANYNKIEELWPMHLIP